MTSLGPCFRGRDRSALTTTEDVANGKGDDGQRRANHRCGAHPLCGRARPNDGLDKHSFVAFDRRRDEPFNNLARLHFSGAPEKERSLCNRRNCASRRISWAIGRVTAMHPIKRVGSATELYFPPLLQVSRNANLGFAWSCILGATHRPVASTTKDQQDHSIAAPRTRCTEGDRAGSRPSQFRTLRNTSKAAGASNARSSRPIDLTSPTSAELQRLPAARTRTWATRRSGSISTGGAAFEGRCEWTIHFDEPGRAEVRFKDGQPFHVVDLRRGRSRTVFVCSSDRYIGTFVARSDSELLIRWRVTGLDKGYVSTSAFQRVQGGGAR